MVDDQGFGYHVVPVMGGFKVATLAIEVSAFDEENVRFFMGAFGDQQELVQAYDLSEIQGDLISNSIETISVSTDIFGQRNAGMWNIPRFAFHVVIGQLSFAMETCKIATAWTKEGWKTTNATEIMIWDRRYKSLKRIVELVQTCLKNEIETARSIAEKNSHIRDAKYVARIGESIAAGALKWAKIKGKI